MQHHTRTQNTHSHNTHTHTTHNTQHRMNAFFFALFFVCYCWCCFVTAAHDNVDHQHQHHHPHRSDHHVQSGSGGSRYVYAGNLTMFFCDVKVALNENALNSTNAEALISALVSQMGCNGLRIPLLPQFTAPASYPPGYLFTVQTAKAKGLQLYGSPMEGSWKTVTAGHSNAEKTYSAWVAAYAAAFANSLDFLSTFNEVGSDCDAACMERVVKGVRALLGELCVCLFVCLFVVCVYVCLLFVVWQLGVV